MRIQAYSPAEAPIRPPLTGQATRDGEVTLTTQEGDTVTISVNAEASLAVETNENGRRTLTTSHDVDVDVNVEGDISKEELKDIVQYTRTLGKATRQTARGHEALAEHTLSKLDDYSTVATAEYSYEQTNANSISGQHVSYLA